MTGARHFRAERERRRRTAIRTARAVPGASYMAWQERRPHTCAAGDFMCVNCGEVVTNDTPEDCPGRKPG